MRATSVGLGDEDRRVGRRGRRSGVTSKSLTGIQKPIELPDDAHAGGVRVQADLLGRLAQGGRHEVRVVGLGLAAREADLARRGGRRRRSAR